MIIKNRPVEALASHLMFAIVCEVEVAASHAVPFGLAISVYHFPKFRCKFSGAHSFIVDVDDELIKQHFSEAECLEMENVDVPAVPQLSQDIINYLIKFNGKVWYPIYYLASNTCIYQKSLN